MIKYKDINKIHVNAIIESLGINYVNTWYDFISQFWDAYKNLQKGTENLRNHDYIYDIIGRYGITIVNKISFKE